MKPIFIDDFQYPQADRRGCNPGVHVAQNFRIVLSVSTSGSKGVQPDTAAALPCH